MLIFTHFSVPFFSYILTDKFLNKHDKNSKTKHSIIAGTAGLIPDLLNIHATLTARQNSYSHTIWTVLLCILISLFVVIKFKNIHKSFIFWIPYAVTTHLFLDAISGGIKPLYPVNFLLGDYFIAPHLWIISDICFILILISMYKKQSRKNRVVNAEFFN